MTTSAARMLQSLHRLLLVAIVNLGAIESRVVFHDENHAAKWRAITSEGVELRIGEDQGRSGRALRLDFDFHGGAGYAIARRELAIELPENYQFTFWIRAEAPTNTLEFKLVDPSGDNVWWVNRRDFEFPREWRKITFKKRHISFAWGPLGGGDPKRVAAIEIAITAGTGGRGTVWLEDLTLTRVDPPPATPPEPRASSSSGEARLATDQNPTTEWRTAEGEQTLTLDLVALREFGGLTIDWSERDFARRYAVEAQIEGDEWTKIYEVANSNGGRDYLYLPEAEARRLRLRLTESSRGRGYGIRSISIQPLAWSATPNDFFSAIARDSRRGDYPRYLLSEQSYWTVVGIDGDTAEALAGEDGAVEPGKESFSIEPFFYTEGKLLSWADVTTSQALAQNYLPVPTTTWKTDPLTLSVTADARGERERSAIRVRYRLTTSLSRLPGTLFLALRPFQVNPAAQFLNAPGGFTPIRTVTAEADVILVNGRRVFPRTRANGFGAASFDEGNIVDYLKQDQLPARTTVSDPRGFASAALRYDVQLGAGRPAEIEIEVPLHESDAAMGRGGEGATAWPEKLNRFNVRLPAAAQHYVDTVRSTIAYILINRDAAAIQPGSRSYERSWIRDGSLTSAALLRVGHADAVREFIEWYAPFQFANGKVPCCVDRRGADPVPEHDSHGQLIFLIAEYYRYTQDRALLEKTWPHVVKAVEYIDALRRERMTPEFTTGDKRAFYGLVPQSISHEGYSAKPMHSYWDDFFVLKGLKDAAEIAAALGKDAEEKRFAAIRDEFRANLLASIDRTMKIHGIDFIPGSVELGDFDATSTTIALTPAGELKHLPRAVVERTFEKYYQNFVERQTSAKWDAYTPYELRTVGTFVRLGQKARAHELLRWFFEHQRPRGWNHWAEVVGRERRTTRFIGDMPHTWVGSDFIRSFLDMLAYEDDGELIVGAGVLPEWVRNESVAVERLRTPFGELTYTMRGDGDSLRVQLSGRLAPPGGITVVSPYSGRPVSVSLNGRAIKPSWSVKVAAAPAEVAFTYQK